MVIILVVAQVILLKRSLCTVPMILTLKPIIENLEPIQKITTPATPIFEGEHCDKVINTLYMIIIHDKGQ